MTEQHQIRSFVNGTYMVSTIDLRTTGRACWETMIFPCDERGAVLSWDELYCDRRAYTREEAVQQHQEAVMHITSRRADVALAELDVYMNDPTARNDAGQTYSEYLAWCDAIAAQESAQ